MKFKVEKLKQAEKEINALTAGQKKALFDDYNIIETMGIEYVKRRHLRNEIYEIKTGDVRSLFKYKEDKIILIGLVYPKKSQKAPENYIKTVLNRLKEI